MSEADKIVYASERAETDETACEDLAAWEQEETGQEKNKSNNCVNAAFKFFVIYIINNFASEYLQHGVAILKLSIEY